MLPICYPNGQFVTIYIDLRVMRNAVFVGKSPDFSVLIYLGQLYNLLFPKPKVTGSTPVVGIVIPRPSAGSLA
jgi:hypothetical protein